MRSTSRGRRLRGSSWPRGTSMLTSRSSAAASLITGEPRSPRSSRRLDANCGPASAHRPHRAVSNPAKYPIGGLTSPQIGVVFTQHLFSCEQLWGSYGLRLVWDVDLYPLPHQFRDPYG